MKFQTANKIEKIASKDETCYALNGVYHDKTAKALIATDGHRMIILPVTENEHDDDGIVPLDAIKAARDSAKKNKYNEAPNMTVVDGKVSVPMGGLTLPIVDAQFPEWQRVLPSFNPADKNVVTITINAKYLAELAEALGSRDSGVQISFQLDDTYGPIAVRPSAENGAHAVLMPVRNSVNGDARVNPAVNTHIVNAEGGPLAKEDVAA
jgi:DNA polymerase III sliding clamp (beta) subunit (PCNA family)